MGDDFLRQAAAALRDQHDGNHPNPQATRQRILAAAAKRERSRRRTVFVAMPLAATFVLFTAWAGATGRLSSVVHAVEGTFSGGAPEDRSEKPKVVAGGPADKSHESPVSPPEVTEPPATTANDDTPPASGTTETAPVVPVAPSTSAPRTTAVAHSGSAQPSVRSAPAEERASEGIPAFPSATATSPAIPSAIANEPGAALYTSAHHVHFVEKDPARAIQAWDAYLQAAPNGRFAPEARYNRAIMLVRVGRRDDAVRELRPFADGVYGDYRRADARALIDALESPDAAR